MPVTGDFAPDGRAKVSARKPLHRRTSRARHGQNANCLS